MNGVLLLERPSFWTEARDPESWLRSLVVLTKAKRPLFGSPRLIWERELRSTISRRGASGLFGIETTATRTVLHGCGLLERDRDGVWRVEPAAQSIVAAWQRSPVAGLARFAGHLLRYSPWLRLLVHRLHRGDWELKGWQRIRSGRRGLAAK